jgi:hypothetical protein
VEYEREKGGDVALNYSKIPINVLCHF